MKIFPYQANCTQRDLQASLREGDISRDTYERGMEHLVRAEQCFPRSYTLSSFKGPTGAGIAVAGAGRMLWFGLSKIGEALGTGIGLDFDDDGEASSGAASSPPPQDDTERTCRHEVFGGVLRRAAKQVERLPGNSGGDNAVVPKAAVERVPMAYRKAGEAVRSAAFSDVQKASIARRDDGRYFGTRAAAAANYHKDKLSTLTLATCAADHGLEYDAFARESNWMADSLAAGIDQLVHGALKSLVAPKLLMEVRAAIKRAFSVDWIVRMEKALSVAYPREEYQSDAAVFLLSAIAYRKHLFVANVGANRAFLWKDGALRALSVSHTASDEKEMQRLARQHARSSNFLRARGVTRALVKSDEIASSRPQVACLPWTEVGGGTLLLLSPGVAEAIGFSAMRDALAGAPAEERASRLAQLARSAGAVDDIVVLSAGICDGIQAWRDHDSQI